jgi:hypothetical protein
LPFRPLCQNPADGLRQAARSFFQARHFLCEASCCRSRGQHRGQGGHGHQRCRVGRGVEGGGLRYRRGNAGLLWTLSGATYGPVAALLSEYFPARIRYSSLSIPYHLGTGYFGGFLPLVSQYIVARTGDPYAGLWYTITVVAVALITCLIALPETRGAKMDA